MKLIHNIKRIKKDSILHLILLAKESSMKKNNEKKEFVFVNPNTKTKTEMLLKDIIVKKILERYKIEM